MEPFLQWHRYEPTYAIVRKRYTKTLWGEKQDYIRELMNHANRTGRKLFVVTPEDMARLKDGAQTVTGHWYSTKKNKWFKKPIAPPDVVLRRYGTFEAAPGMRRWLEGRMTFLNPFDTRQVTGDKLQFAQIMEESGVPHPAETRLYTPSDGHTTIREMMVRHGVNDVFIKDRWGKCGNSILQVVRQPDGKFRLNYSRKSASGKPVSKFRIVAPGRLGINVDDVLGMFQQQSGKKSKFIVQTGLPAKQYNRGRFILRVVMSRDEKGKPVIVGGRASVGRPGDVVVNVTQGAKRTEYEPVLQEVYGKDHHQVRKDMERVCRDAFLAVDRQVQKMSGRPVGELGMDVVFVGKKAHIIEANSLGGIETYDPYFDRYKETIFQAGKYAFRQTGVMRQPG